jgi:hypothetical protein
MPDAPRTLVRMVTLDAETMFVSVAYASCLDEPGSGWLRPDQVPPRPQEGLLSDMATLPLPARAFRTAPEARDLHQFRAL